MTQYTQRVMDTTMVLKKTYISSTMMDLLVQKENRVLQVPPAPQVSPDPLEREEHGVQLVLTGVPGRLGYLVRREQKVILDCPRVKRRQVRRVKEDGWVHRVLKVKQVQRVPKAIQDQQVCLENRVCQDCRVYLGRQVTLAGRVWQDRRETLDLKVSMASSDLQELQEHQDWKEREEFRVLWESRVPKEDRVLLVMRVSEGRPDQTETRGLSEEPAAVDSQA